MQEVPGTGGLSPDLDIVFVHGINPTGNPNHAHDTWTHEDGTCWPRMLLPQLVPSARIFIFAYNSSVLRNASNAPVATHAESLLNDVKNRRLNENEKHRPLIFVAHSLGGLLVKQALIEARIDDRNYGFLKASTYGLVFFATPHLGGNKAGIADVAANFCSIFTGEPSNSLLETLKSNSLINEISSDQFSHQQNDYDILTFYETRKMDVKFKKSVFRTKVTSMYIVDRTSAKLRSERETALDLDRDHSTICKFAAATDAAYVRVSLNVKNMADEARRFQVECSHSPRRSSEPNLVNSNFFSNDIPGAMPLHFAVDEDYRRINLPRKSGSFRGRTALIQNINHIWQTWEGLGQRRLCFSGLGGVGKTEFSRFLVDELDTGHHVIWLRASDSKTLQDDLETAALELMHLLLRSDTPNYGSSGSQEYHGFYFSANSTPYLLKKLKARLRSEDADKRILLILDDLDGLEAEKRQELADDFCGKSVDLIYTTRDPLMADPGMAWDAVNINIPPLELDHGVELLMILTGPNRKGKSRVSETQWQPDKLPIRAVVQRLGPLPSAIIIGSHYLKDHLGLSLLGLQKFINTWDGNENRSQILASRRDLVRYPYSITESFAVSFSRLERNTKGDPTPDLYEHCLKLLRLLSAMGVASLYRQHLDQLSEALRDLYNSMSTLGVVLTSYAQLHNETLVTLCIMELKRVSLLAEVEEGDDEVISLNGLVRSAVGSGSPTDLDSRERIDLDMVAELMKQSRLNQWFTLA